MLIEPVELTLAHVGLGALGEVPLLALFASAQAHALVAGTGATLRDVTDATGATLYPGYSWLRLRVPPSLPLDRFHVWDRVDVGVDVKRFGSLVLDSTYVLGAPGELATPAWDLDALPSMRAMSVWIVDGKQGDPQPSAPRLGSIASLAPVPSAPEAMMTFRAIKLAGTFGREPRRWSMQTRYPIRVGRDVAIGHRLMFATYVEIMQVAEETLLREHLSVDLLAHRRLLEREVVFVSHAGVGAEVLVDVRAALVPCADDVHGAATDVVSAAILDLAFELYEAGTNTLLAVARAKQLFLVPRDATTDLRVLRTFA